MDAFAQRTSRDIRATATRIRVLVPLALLVATATFVSPATTRAATIAPPALSVPSATLITIQGRQVWSRKADAQRRVASTIKMLNALVVRDRAKLDDVVVVSKQAAAVPEGGVGLVAGQRLTVRQLLGMMLIPSGNDAAVALAVHVGGTQAKFVALMNAKAKALGLKNTRATDPNGLGKTETCTAADLSVLARRVMADSVLRSIVGQRSVSVPRPKGKAVVYASTNQLLGHYTGIEGTKTGWTNPAGYCLVATAKRGDVEIVGVVLGANSNAGRFSQMRTLLDWGFAHVHQQRLLSADATLGGVPLIGGADATVAVCATRTVAMALYDGGGYVKRRLKLSLPLAAPLAAGQVVGIVEVYQGASLVATAPIVTRSAVGTASVPATVSLAPAMAPPRMLVTARYTASSMASSNWLLYSS